MVSRNFDSCISIPAPNEPNFEGLFVDILGANGFKVRIGTFYRPPINENSCNSLINYLKVGLQCSFNTIVVGDFNFPEINFDDTKAPIARGQHQFLDFCILENLSQLVFDPTRGENILDLVLTMNPSSISSVSVNEPFLGSDHNKILVNLFQGIAKHENFFNSPNFWKADFPSIKAYLGTLDWNIIFANCGDINQYWNTFLDILKYTITEWVPQ